MATSFLTPNMNLLVPVVGQELAPTWASDLNSSLGIIDTHNHAPGSGVQINPDGIFINGALAFNSNQATGLGFSNYTPQGTGVAVPTNYSTYVSGVDLFFKDGAGNTVQLTTGGAVNATSSGISSGTNTASFVSNILVVSQSVGVAAAIDAATYILRYNGSYPSPAGNFIALEAPSSLSTGYALVFPAALPGSTLPVSLSAAGNLSTSLIAGSQIAALTISDGNIANGTIGIGKFAAGAIQASDIANGTITGTQITNDVNLPGVAAKVGGHNIMVSFTNEAAGVAVIRALINQVGTVLAGSGVASATVIGTGVYTVTFNSSYSALPVAVASTGIGLTASVSSIAVGSLQVDVRATTTGAPTAGSFNLIVMGI